MTQPFVYLKQAFSQANTTKWKENEAHWLYLEQKIHHYILTYFGQDHVLLGISTLRLADAYEANGALAQALRHALEAFRYYLKNKKKRPFLKLSAIRLIRYYHKMEDGDELSFFYHKLRREGALDRQVLWEILPYLFHLDPVTYGDTIESFIQEGLAHFVSLERATLLLNAGVFYDRLGRTDEAISALQEGIKEFQANDSDQDYLWAAYVLLQKHLKGFTSFTDNRI